MSLAAAVVLLASTLVVTAEASTAARFKRVIGGFAVSNPSESPWMVSLQGREVTKSFLGIPLDFSTRYCGGTLINDRWILTAAHCFKGYNTNWIPANKWHARLASPSLQATANEQLLTLLGRALQLKNWRGTNFHVEEIILHPGYVHQDSWRNDIALVKLSESVTLNSNVNTGLIALPNSSTTWPRDRQTCHIYGWGCTRAGEAVSSQIMKVGLPKINDVLCSQQWEVSTDSRLCAGGRNLGRSACKGDSGGPLICTGADGQPTQAGIVSFVHSQQPQDHSVVSTRVSHYVQWINATIAAGA